MLIRCIDRGVVRTSVHNQRITSGHTIIVSNDVQRAGQSTERPIIAFDRDRAIRVVDVNRTQARRRDCLSILHTNSVNVEDIKRVTTVNGNITKVACGYIGINGDRVCRGRSFSNRVDSQIASETCSSTIDSQA